MSNVQNDSKRKKIQQKNREIYISHLYSTPILEGDPVGISQRSSVLGKLE